MTAGRNPSATPAVRPRLAVWIGAARPRTLTMALAPVFVGGCFASAFGGGAKLSAIAVAALSAVCIQVATNLFNDAGDFERGGDGLDRLGPPRAAASGLLTPVEIKRAACGFFAVAALGGLYLIAIGGWPILSLGALSLASGWAYASGPAPISYSPLGEIFVIAFFASAPSAEPSGSVRARWRPNRCSPGSALGLFAAGVLMVNNVRDAEADAPRRAPHPRHCRRSAHRARPVRRDDGCAVPAARRDDRARAAARALAGLRRGPACVGPGEKA